MSQKLQFTFLLAFLWITGYSQNFPDSLTAQHQLVVGTNISMIPPEAYELTGNFKGFQNPDDQTSMIMIMELPGPYSEVSKGFEKEMMEARGMQLKSKKEISIAGFPGVLITLDQPASGLVFSKHILVYGDESATSMINGVFLKDSIDLGKAIEQSILSTYVDTNLIADPRNNLDYTLDETVGDLQFHSVIGNGMLFNRDLKIPTESEDMATLITDKSFSNFEIDNKEQFCISRLQQYPDDLSMIVDRGLENIELDGLKGIGIYAKNNDDESEEMYQLILFEEEAGYYLFVGSYQKGKDKAIADIKRIIQTFKRK